MSERFVANCTVCKKPIPSEQLKYSNGKEFHVECFEKHGDDFSQMNSELLNEISKIRVELIKLKNLQSRLGSKRSSGSKRTKKRKSKKTKKKRSSRKRKRSVKKKARKRKVKKRTKTRKIRRKAKRRSTTKRKPSRQHKSKRRISRRKSKKRRVRRR